MASLRSQRALTEQTNENIMQQSRQLRNKAAAGMEKAISTRQRTALGEIGNNKSQNILGSRKENAGIGGIIKPPRLTKQVGTTSLKSIVPNTGENAAVIRPKRTRSGEKIPEESKEDKMEVEPTKEEAVDECVMEVDEVVAHSTRNIENIDLEDMNDPQLVSEYVNEIYGYMRELEEKQSVRKNYLDKHKVTAGVILPKMRSVLVDWLVEVHQQFSLLQETLFLAVAILDRYMQERADKIPRKKLQLVGVTSMFIAAKYEEMYAPEIGDFVYITDNAYSQAQIRTMEQDIMAVLRFDLGRPLPLHFLRRNSKAGQVDATIHTLAKYAMELTLVEYNWAHVPPSKTAAAALAISLLLLERDENKTIQELWTETVSYYSNYTLESIRDNIVELASLIVKTSSANEAGKIMAVRKKYANKKFAKISQIPELTGEAAHKLAEGDF